MGREAPCCREQRGPEGEWMGVEVEREPVAAVAKAEAYKAVSR